MCFSLSTLAIRTLFTRNKLRTHHVPDHHNFWSNAWAKRVHSYGDHEVHDGVYAVYHLRFSREVPTVEYKADTAKNQVKHFHIADKTIPVTQF